MYTIVLSVRWYSAKDLRGRCCHVDYVKILSNGTCVWYREFALTVTHCPMDIAWFPFDEQRCPLIYESKRYESHELNASIDRRGGVALHVYQESGEWNLIGML